MAPQDRLVEVWAADPTGSGRGGTGWVIGDHAVLTCRHVIEPYLSAAEREGDMTNGHVLECRLAAASSGEDWRSCVVAWEHQTADIVLLRIVPSEDNPWVPPRSVSLSFASIGEQPRACTATGFPKVQVRPSRLRGSEQVPGKVLPGGGARDKDGLVPFDVDSSVPDDAEGWLGISGSAVLDKDLRVVGVVVKADPDRQRRRLLVLPVEDIAEDPGFAPAAEKLGFDDVIEVVDAPWWRRVAESHALSREGDPPRIHDVHDLMAFGVRKTTDLEYVSRDRDVDLSDALEKARQGGRRFVLVTGDSAAGKSRSAAEAVRRNPTISSWRLVVPIPDRGVTRLTGSRSGLSDTIVWLDDLDKHLSKGLNLDTVGGLLDRNPSVVVVATIRKTQFDAHQSDLTDPAWTFLTENPDVARIDLEAELSDRERQAAIDATDDTALHEALTKGVGLGEWLVAGPELWKKLAESSGPNRPSLRQSLDGTEPDSTAPSPTTMPGNCGQIHSRNRCAIGSSSSWRRSSNVASIWRRPGPVNR